MRAVDLTARLRRAGVTGEIENKNASRVDLALLFSISSVTRPPKAAVRSTAPLPAYVRYVSYVVDALSKSKFSVIRVPSLRNDATSRSIRRRASLASWLFNVMFNKSMYHGSLIASST